MCEPAPLSPTCRLGLVEPMLPLYNFRTNKKLLFNLYTVPMLIKLELETTLVLGLYKLSVDSIGYSTFVIVLTNIIPPPPPPRFTNAQLLQEKE